MNQNNQSEAQASPDSVVESVQQVLSSEEGLSVMDKTAEARNLESGRQISFQQGEQPVENISHQEMSDAEAAPLTSFQAKAKDGLRMRFKNVTPLRRRTLELLRENPDMDGATADRLAREALGLALQPLVKAEEAVEWQGKEVSKTKDDEWTELQRRKQQALEANDLAKYDAVHERMHEIASRQADQQGSQQAVKNSESKEISSQTVGGKPSRKESARNQTSFSPAPGNFGTSGIRNMINRDAVLTHLSTLPMASRKEALLTVLVEVGKQKKKV